MDTNLTRYEFLIVFIGMIVGLALSKLAEFAGSLLANEERARLSLSLPHIVWLCILLIAQVYYWWTLWEARQLGELGFISYFFLLFLPLLAFSATAVLCPECERTDIEKLSTYFSERASVFYYIVITYLLLGAIQAKCIWSADWFSVVLRVFGVVVIIPDLCLRRPTVDRAIAFTSFILLVFYIYLYAVAPT